MDKLLDKLDAALDLLQIELCRIRLWISRRQHLKALKAQKDAIDELGRSIHRRVVIRRRPMVIDLRNLH